MSKKAEINPCIRCKKLPGENDQYCTDCGAPVVNRCSDEPSLLSKGCNFINDPKAAYCSRCGEPTLFLLHGLIPLKNENGNSMLDMFHSWQQILKNFNEST